MNHLLMAAGAILFSVGVLQKPKNSVKVQSKAKNVPSTEKADDVKNEQTSNINPIDPTDNGGLDHIANMAETHSGEKPE